VQRCVELKAPLTPKVVAAAASTGDLALVKKVKALGCEWDASALAMAAGNGHGRVLFYLLSNGCPYSLAEGKPWGDKFSTTDLAGGCTVTPVAAAAATNRVSLLEQMVATKVPILEADWLFIRGIKHKTVNWLLDHGWPLTINSVNCAISQSQVEVLKEFLKRPGCPWDPANRPARVPGGTDLKNFLATTDAKFKEQKTAASGTA